MITLRSLLAFLILLIPRAWGEEVSAKTTGALLSKPAAQITKGQRIFASHHSYFVAIPAILKELAVSAGIEGQEIVGSHYIGGSKSIQHWNIKDEDNEAKKALVAGKVDVLILTPVYLPDEGIEKFARFGLETNPAIRVTVQEFWLPYDAYEPHYYDPPKIPHPDKVDHNAMTGAQLREIHECYFHEMDELITGLNKQLGKQVIFAVPAGQAVIALREKIIAGQAPGLKSQEDIFTDSLGHPKAALQALIAYAHFAVIYRKSPVGFPVPQVLSQTKLPTEELDGLNRLLQELAWDAVIHHPLSGVAN
jgi:hypothetical protein